MCDALHDNYMLGRIQGDHAEDSSAYYRHFSVALLDERCQRFLHCLFDGMETNPNDVTDARDQT